MFRLRPRRVENKDSFRTPGKLCSDSLGCIGINGRKGLVDLYSILFAGSGPADFAFPHISQHELGIPLPRGTVSATAAGLHPYHFPGHKLNASLRSKRARMLVRNNLVMCRFTAGTAK